MSFRLMMMTLLCLTITACTKRAPPVEADVWALAHDLGHAAMLSAYGKPDRAKTPFAKKATKLSQKLVASDPPALPEPRTTREDGDSAFIGYVDGAATMHRAKVESKLGVPRAALFELGLRSLAAPVLHDPNHAPMRVLLVSELRSLAGPAGVPTEVIQPLLDKLGAGASQREVQDEVNRLHEKMPTLIASGKLARTLSTR